MNFVAIDVETANADMSSICQIGLVLYNEGKIQEEWKTYIDPEDYFDMINISIHGIDEETVKGAPKLSEVSGHLHNFLNDRISVCHTHFDRVAIQQGFEKYNLQSPNCIWLDSARVARRTWNQFAQRGYGLMNICEYLGYNFNPHDALEDARAAGFIMTKAIEETNLSIDDWLKRVKYPIGTSYLDFNHRIKRDGNKEGPFYGEVLVFTGALEIPRREAAELAAQVGCNVSPSVNKETTILVVGDQDVRKLGGKKKSSKHRKAELLISKGHIIRIIRETDFKKLVSLAK